MSSPCNNRWKTDDTFLRGVVKKDSDGNRYIPFCTHPSHYAVIMHDNDYRKKRCEREGKPTPCPYYQRFIQASISAKEYYADEIK
jgi:hypothetical protein